MYLSAKKNPLLVPAKPAVSAAKLQAPGKSVVQDLKKAGGRENGSKKKLVDQSVSFLLNGSSRTVTVGEFGVGMSLAQYIREVALLTGTKVSCNEGGCGACIVTVKKSADDQPRSLNSCLCPVLICDGWEITTIEGLGGKSAGYHPIQSKLAEDNGTQCGYCSPGMVMQLYSWLQEHPEATKLQIDNILDGNICRCTGYRPILDAFKSFAADNSDFEIPDIEELKICKKSGQPCQGTCGGGPTKCSSKLDDNYQWYAPTNVEELVSILKGFDENMKYRLVSGNTGTGVYKNDGPWDAFIDINKIAELHSISVGDEVALGANVKITDAINALETTDNEVWRGIAHHMRQIASYGIRNQGSLAGNLMMKHFHNDFPSDVFLSLETAGAQAEVMDSSGIVSTIAVADIPTVNLDKKILLKIKIKLENNTIKSKVNGLNSLWMSRHNAANVRAGAEWKYRSFKIMPRSSNAHAYVNAGFMALVDKSDGFKILSKPRIVYGGISSTFIHAKSTENFLDGRNMNDHDVFVEALGVLAEELILDDEPELASPLYRKQLALGLFYKFFLYVLGDAASETVRSGAYDIERGLTSSQQSWESDESQFPISEPVEKYEAKIQCAGEAEYVNDIPPMNGELQAAFVLTTVANCDVVSVEPSEALAMEGVHGFVDASDIPGNNEWVYGADPDPIFCTGKSQYAGQAIGLIVADTQEIALAAAKKVKVSYANFGPVITDIEQAMQDPSYVASGGYPMAYGDATSALEAADTVVSGQFKMGSQYHFYMETHVCIARPSDDGFDLELPTQDMATVANVVSKAVGTTSNSINISVKRLGGAYGGKISLPTLVASAATVAAKKLNKSVRLWVNMEDTMCMLGKRTPYYFDYQIGFDSNRKIVGVKSKLYCDAGWTYNNVDSFFAQFFGQSCYHIPNLDFTPFGVKTHTQAQTATRAPGMVNGHAMLETMMEQAAAEMKVNPLELRINNLMYEGSPILPYPAFLDTPCPISDMIDQVKESGNFDLRKQEVDLFNQKNRWKKRALTMVPMRYGHVLKGFGIKYHCLVSVFAGDGTISVTHAGIEMGQGINTKVRQVVASELKVDMNMIKVKPAMNVVSPNATVTGGSFGSELNCAAAIKACEILNARLQEYREKLGTSASWVDIVQAANLDNVDLCARFMFCPENDSTVDSYSIWGVVLTEVEVDILTGEKHIRRCDLLEDAGLSTSPLVDIGQVEGAFVMGLGLFTSEELKYHPETGALLTKNTWEYKPPAAKDIPEDFRVTLLNNSRNPKGILSSKATGEPGMLLSISVLFAIRAALNESRKDNNMTEGWWKLDAPATVEKIHQHAGIDPNNFVF